MRIVVAMDSFKGSLTSLQAGHAVREAALRHDEQNEVIVCPLADGGEGTVDALISGLGGVRIERTVTGPRFAPVTAQYCILEDSRTAVIEMAAAAGLPLLPPELRDPMETTTLGVGELIRDAIGHGCRRFLIGLGGSATNDGGIGMLSALGFTFTDRSGAPITPTAKGLEHLHAISAENALPELRECTFRVACDVSNPLCGKNGCSTVFGPQKGGTLETIEKMDRWLCRYAQLTHRLFPAADMTRAGAGAAGGLGFAFLAFTHAELESGVKILLDETHLEEYVRTADLVVTGEGRLDAQTVMGKAPIGVAELAKKYGKRVIAFSGCATQDAEQCNEHGIDAFFPILRGVSTLEEALQSQNAYRNLEATAYQVFRLLAL